VFFAGLTMLLLHHRPNQQMPEGPLAHPGWC